MTLHWNHQSSIPQPIQLPLCCPLSNRLCHHLQVIWRHRAWHRQRLSWDPPDRVGAPEQMGRHLLSHQRKLRLPEKAEKNSSLPCLCQKCLLWKATIRITANWWPMKRNASWVSTSTRFQVIVEFMESVILDFGQRSWLVWRLFSALRALYSAFRFLALDELCELCIDCCRR